MKLEPDISNLNHGLPLKALDWFDSSQYEYSLHKNNHNCCKTIIMSCSICMYLHFFSGLPGALCCLLSFFLLTLFLLGFIESIYFVLKLDGIFKRLASRVMSLRFPPIQKDRCIRRNSHTEVGAGESGTSLSLKPCCAQSLVKLTFTHTETWVSSSWSPVKSTAHFPLKSDVPGAV